MMESLVQEEKQCSKCHETFPATLTYFKAAKGNKGGLHTRCRPCALEDRRQSWHKHADRINTKRRSNPEKRREQFQAWAAKHPGYHLEWYVRHQASVLARAHARYQDDPVKFRAQGIRAGAERRRRISALPNLLTDTQRQEALNFWHGCCAVCGAAPGEDGKALAHDHWIPLVHTHCPGTVAWNSVPLCNGRNGCNTRKHDQDASTFLRRYFMKDRTAADQKYGEIDGFLRMMQERYDSSLMGGATL